MTRNLPFIPELLFHSSHLWSSYLQGDTKKFKPYLINPALSFTYTTLGHIHPFLHTLSDIFPYFFLTTSSIYHCPHTYTLQIFSNTKFLFTSPSATSLTKKISFTTTHLFISIVPLLFSLIPFL